MPKFRLGSLLWFVAGTAIALLIGAAIFYEIALRHRAIHVADGFENPGLNSIWTANRMVPGAFSIENKIVRSGHSAGAITLHPKDRYEEESSEGAASERDELMEASQLWSQMGAKYAYEFSLYLPKDFPVADTRLVVAQWKQECGSGNCRPDNPILAIRYVAGVLSVTRHSDIERVILYKSQGDIRGRWLDFRFVIRFSQGAEGKIEAWMNGQQIVAFRGPTAYASPGYSSHDPFYFKMGLYRDLMSQPMTIYFDDYRKDQCPNCGDSTF
jgi:Polysaccharide lyase